jgi:hypothetical protein
VRHAKPTRSYVRLTFVSDGGRNLREALDGGVPFLGGRVAAQNEHNALRVPAADGGVDVLPRQLTGLGERRRVQQLHHVALPRPRAVDVGPGHHGLDHPELPRPFAPAAGRRSLRPQQQRAVLGRQRPARRVDQRALAVGAEPRDQHGRRRRGGRVLLGVVAVLVVCDKCRECLADLPAERGHGVLPAEARRDNERQRPGSRRRGYLEEEGQPRHAHQDGASATGDGEGSFGDREISRGARKIDGSFIDTAIIVGMKQDGSCFWRRFALEEGRRARIRFALDEAPCRARMEYDHLIKRRPRVAFPVFASRNGSNAFLPTCF